MMLTMRVLWGSMHVTKQQGAVHTDVKLSTCTTPPKRQALRRHGGRMAPSRPCRRVIGVAGAHYRGCRCPLQGVQVPIIGVAGAH